MAGTMRTVWVGFGKVRVEEAPLRESRINAHLGLQLGPAPDDRRSWDEKQLPATDVSGNQRGGQ